MGPYGHQLLQLDGPIVPWQSVGFSPTLASGAGHNVSLAIGNNRGMVGAYANIKGATLLNYPPGDTIQITPDLMQPAGSPGGQLAMRLNPSKLTSLAQQGIFVADRTSGSDADIAGSSSAELVYRALLAAGPGPYAPSLRGQAPRGVLVAGETAEFAYVGATQGVGAPAGLTPFMWTLYGRCLVAEGGCQPGDIMAFGSYKGAATVKGWSTSYSRKNSYFTLARYSATPNIVGKDGSVLIPTPGNWALFFRFVAISNGPYPTKAIGRLRPGPLRMWMSPPVPHSNGLVPVSFACPEGFNPVLANSYYLCKTAEYGYSVGDWVPAQEGNNNGNNGGFSAVFDGRNAVLAPQTFNNTQYIHRLDSVAYALMTPANWSWFFVFVG
jgi:hypothetical protein